MDASYGAPTRRRQPWNNGAGFAFDAAVAAASIGPDSITASSSIDSVSSNIALATSATNAATTATTTTIATVTDSVSNVVAPFTSNVLAATLE